MNGPIDADVLLAWSKLPTPAGRLVLERAELLRIGENLSASDALRRAMAELAAAA